MMMLCDFLGEWENGNLSNNRAKEGFERIAKELAQNPGLTDIEYYSDFLTYYQDMITFGNFGYNHRMGVTLEEFVDVEMDDGFGTEGMRL